MSTVHINQFKGADDMAVFRAAAEYLRNNADTVLVLDSKTYYLKDEKAVTLQKDIMRGKYTKNPERKIFTYEFEYRIGIDLKGAKNVTIEGNGAALVFDGFMENISCQFCSGVTLRNFSIDLKRPAYSRGKIIKSGKFLGVPYMDADFGDLPLLSARMPTLRMLCSDSISSLILGVTRALCARKIGNGRYRFLFSADHGGNEVYLTHTYHFKPSILIYEASDTKIENITIYTHCGMGIVGHRSHNILLDGLRIIPKAGLCMSTNTDATHFSSCTGLLKYINCEFDGHGDDASNVHTYYHSIIKRKGNSFVLKTKAPTGTHCSKPDYFGVGDSIEMCRYADLDPIKTLTVKSVVPDFDKHTQTVVFNEELPKIEKKVLFADVSQLPRLEFVNSTVRNHIARAILVRTRDVLIEGNRFDCRSWAAIHVASEVFWHEGVACKNVIIRNNTMLNYGVGVLIGISAPNPVKPAHQNILIENNYISPSGNQPIEAKYVNGLVIRNNTFNTEEKELNISNCGNVVVSGNKFVGSK